MTTQALAGTDLERRIEARYQASGYSWRLWEQHRALLRRLIRMAGSLDAVTAQHMEDIVLSASRTNSRATYAEQLKSLWGTLRALGLVDTSPEATLPNIKRTKSSPRPLSHEQARVLLTESSEPMRDWFVLGCLAGLRAMEVSGLMGSDLEDSADGYMLRVRGKGGHEISVPAHPEVVDLIKRHRTLGRLYRWDANRISRHACAEMRRLDVQMSFHSCRHYFATTVLAASGGDIVTTASLMRHASITTTMTYAKLADDRPRNVLNTLTLPSSPTD